MLNLFSIFQKQKQQVETDFKAPTDKGYLISKVVDGTYKPVMWFDVGQYGLGCGKAADPNEAAKLVEMLSGLVIDPRPTSQPTTNDGGDDDGDDDGEQMKDHLPN